MEKALELNAKLQQKKCRIRQELANRGPIKKDKENGFAKYSYLSEAAYKQLFTELLPAAGLELTSSCEEVIPINDDIHSLLTKWRFILSDTETGYSEEAFVYGQGQDKGDKALYKAHTGAMKYYFANTFLVASGDDAEADDPRVNGRKRQVRTATREQVEYLARVYQGPNLEKLLGSRRIASLEQLRYDDAASLIQKVEARG